MNESEVEVIDDKTSVEWCDDSVEYATGTVVSSLSDMVKGLTSSYETEAKKETLDSLLDVVDALTKTLAVHHKGREVRGKNMQLASISKLPMINEPDQILDN